MSGDPLDNVPVEAWSELRAERDALQAEVERLQWKNDELLKTLNKVGADWNTAVERAENALSRVEQLEQALREIMVSAEHGTLTGVRLRCLAALHPDQQGRQG